jgi:DNA-binding response OmpR family regulator
MKKNILIVEDESIVAMEIESYLNRCNYNIVGICSNGDEAYELAIHLDIDLILMDIFLLNSNGIETAMKIKQKKNNMPIIFLTAYMDDETIDKAVATNPVAYLIKPFNRKELLASIKIGLRDYTQACCDRVGDIYLDEEFSFDSRATQLICCGEVVHLSKKEKMLLVLFLDNMGGLTSSVTIEYELWPDKPSSDTRLRTLISRLRAKLKHKFIETCSAEGYIFRV